MMQKPMKFASVVVAVSLFCRLASGAETEKFAESSVFGVFVGSSPCTNSLGSVLRIPADPEMQIRWKVTLRQDPKTNQPAGYELQYVYQPATSVTTPSKLQVQKKTGSWTIVKGTKWKPDALVYELHGAFALYQLNRDLLHILGPDRSLMVGNGSWSCTLNRAESAEPLGTSAPTPSIPPSPYKILPEETGPTVFGVFSGRTPYQGIIRQMTNDANARGTKLKWVVTLFQDPETKAPTTYRLEGTFFRNHIREGKWNIVNGTVIDPKAVVYQLQPSMNQSGLSLLKGDDNVLFFADDNGTPMVGHAEFSYTLNRVETSP